MKKHPFTGYQLFLIIVLAIIQFTIMLDFMIIAPLGAHLNRVMNITSSQFGLVVSAYAFSAATAGLITGLFADKYDRKKLLIFFYTGFIAGTILCGLANSYAFLLLSRIVSGAFGGVIAAIIFTIITDMFPFEIRGRAISYVQIAFSASQVMGIPIGLFLTNKFNWHIPFLSIAVLSVFMLLIVIKNMSPIKKQIVTNEKDFNKRFIKILFSKKFSVAYITTALLAIGGFLLMPFASIFLVHNIGISESQLPLIYMAAGGCTVIAGPILGILSDRYGKSKIFTAGSIVLLIAVAIYTNLSSVSLFIVILINCLLYIGVSSRTISGMASITSLPARDERGSFMSINSSVQQLSGGIASVAGGIITYQNPSGLLINFNVLGMITILLVVASVFSMFRIDSRYVVS